MISTHHLAVSRTARYHTIGALHGDARDVWFVCHGYGQLSGSFIRRFEALADPGRLVVAPEALSRFYLGDHTRPAGPDAKVGASWMTRDDRELEIADYVGYLDALYDHVFRVVPRPAARVHVLGFSQGTATAGRWVLQGRVRADRMILWGGPLPHDTDLGAAAVRLDGVELVLVVGSGDHYITPKVRTMEETRLRQAGIPFRTVEYAGGHDLDSAALGRLVEA